MMAVQEISVCHIHYPYLGFRETSKCVKFLESTYVLYSYDADRSQRDRKLFDKSLCSVEVVAADKVKTRCRVVGNVRP